MNDRSYCLQYLNSGAGCIGGVFVHSKNFGNDQMSRLDGWWGNRASTRFAMLDGKHDTSPPRMLRIVPIRHPDRYGPRGECERFSH